MLQKYKIERQIIEASEELEKTIKSIEKKSKKIKKQKALNLKKEMRQSGSKIAISEPKEFGSHRFGSSDCTYRK